MKNGVDKNKLNFHDYDDKYLAIIVDKTKILTKIGSSDQN